MATKKCVAQGSKGAACTDEGDCLNALLCEGGVCTAPAPEPVCP
jgi:hypothetical protein